MNLIVAKKHPIGITIDPIETLTKGHYLLAELANSCLNLQQKLITRIYEDYRE